MWLITNKKDAVFLSNTEVTHFSSFSFITNKGLQHQQSGSWFCKGYVLPRNFTNQKFNKHDCLKQLDNLYSKNPENFINSIKGAFSLIHIQGNRFRVYSDHFGVEKYFVWQVESDFIISNSLTEIAKLVNLKPSIRNIHLYALTYHFTGGSTLFENVCHNMPGQCLEFNEKGLVSKFFWKPENLLKLPQKNLQIEELSNVLQQNIDSCLSFDPNHNVSLSITGGTDTRNLLSLFLKKGINPHLYTYGNPKSSDCLKAIDLTKGLNLNHSLYDIELNANTFEQYARKIVRLGGGMASIHRVHRLIAIEKERQFADIMFLGTLGGEYVRGVSEDDYIIPSIVYENWNTNLTIDSLRKHYLKKGLRITNQIVQETYLTLANQPYLNGEEVFRKLAALSYITAHLHDAQDVNLYKTVMTWVFTPFLDIDYLELLFSSPYSFDKKLNEPNSLLRRLENPVYSSRFLAVNYKPLLKYKYTGEHKPSEVLFSKFFAAFAKQTRRFFAPTYPPNFPLGVWMEEFVKDNLPKCNDHSYLRDAFELEQLQSDLHNNKHQTVESYWLKYTNPIMIKFIIEEFCYGTV